MCVCVLWKHSPVFFFFFPYWYMPSDRHSKVLQKSVDTIMRANISILQKREDNPSMQHASREKPNYQPVSETKLSNQSVNQLFFIFNDKMALWPFSYKVKMLAMKMLWQRRLWGKMLMAKILNILCHTRPYMTKIVNYLLYQYLWAANISQCVGQWKVGNSEYGEVRKGSSNSSTTIWSHIWRRWIKCLLSIHAIFSGTYSHTLYTRTRLRIDS